MDPKENVLVVMRRENPDHVPFRFSFAPPMYEFFVKIKVLKNPLIKAKHSEKLFDRYRMRFGMGPIMWAQLDSNQRPLLCKRSALTN